jgi:sec-independent protein translocase protein TatA
MFGLGRFEELLVILVIVLVLFGGKKLPELSRGVSSSIREIRKGFHNDVSDEEEKPVEKKEITREELPKEEEKKEEEKKVE